jgi:hypothetical protein
MNRKWKTIGAIEIEIIKRADKIILRFSIRMSNNKKPEPGNEKNSRAFFCR